MSTNKLLQSLSEDPQLEKQIGCMAGILQLFDRHQVLTGRRLYGHKRITAAGSKSQTPVPSNFESPFSDSCGTPNEKVLRSFSEEQGLKHSSATGSGTIAEQQKSQPPQTPTTPTEPKINSAFARTPLLPSYETSAITDVPAMDKLPKISFDIARSNLLAPRRLDSSRSLHEARANVAYESKVHARKSVDTAERAAAAARGALKELSRMPSDFSRPCHHEDQLSIRDIVRSSLSQDPKLPRPLARASLSGSNPDGRNAHPQRIANEAGTFFTRASGSKDASRAQTVETRSSSERPPLQAAARTSNSPGAGRVDAPKPPRHPNPKVETPSKNYADIEESLRLLAKLREASPALNASLGSEGAEDTVRSKYSSTAHNVSQRSRSSLVDNGRDEIAISSRAFLPRVASDRAPSRMSSFESSWESSADSLLQGGPKSREAPRFSLDGLASGGVIKADREVGSQGKLQPRVLLTSRSVSCSNSDCDTESLQEKRTSFSSNVVAKLMGLDEFPSEELLPVYPKLGPSCSTNQGVSNTVVQDTSPKFMQCGKFVSASFFPSRRRDGAKIPFDFEEDEKEVGEEEDDDDDDLLLELLSRQDGRALNVRTSSLKLQAVDRLVSTNGGHLVQPCYQPKNHHLMEDRPPHVLSPAAKLCAQIEELQRGEFLHKDFDRGTSGTVMSQQGPKQELEALKQLLGAINLRKDYMKSYVEKLPFQGLPVIPQPKSGRIPFVHEQAEQPFSAAWKEKRMWNNEASSQIDGHNSTGRRMSIGSHTRKMKPDMYKEAAHRLPNQTTPPRIYNQSSRVRPESYASSVSSDLSMYNTLKKATIKNSPASTPSLQTNHATGGQRTTSNPHASRSQTSSRTSSNQHLLALSSGSCSWEASSVSSSSSNNAMDSYVLENSSNHAANRQIESAQKRKTHIFKDREEGKANLVSGKAGLLMLGEKKVKSEKVLAIPKPDCQRGRKPAETQNADNNHRSGNRRILANPAGRKAVDVKRKLNFPNRFSNRRPPAELSGGEDQGAQFVDKTIVTCIEKSLISNSSVEPHESGDSSVEQYELGNRAVKNSCMPANSHGYSFDLPVITATSTDHGQSEDGMQSPKLLDAVSEPSTHNQNGALASIDRNSEEANCLVRTPKGALRLPQMLQEQQNEDTESQGDKSTGSCEQPSPISVLEGPFYEDDTMPSPATNKFVLKLEEMEEEARGKESAGSPTSHTSPPVLLLDVNKLKENLTDHEYVTHLLKVSCLQEQISDKNCFEASALWRLKPLEFQYLLQLEEEIMHNLNVDEACNGDPGTSMLTRKLLFDNVKASLDKKMHTWLLCQHQPWVLSCECGLHGTITRGWSAALQHGTVGIDEENRMCLSNEGGEVLLEEVWKEIEASIARQRGMSSKMCTQGVSGITCEGEVEEKYAYDDLGHMLEEDILHGSQYGCPDAWVDLLPEKGELGLDLERLIFKDLIDHTIRDLGGFLLHSSSSLPTKRQLFRLHT